MKKRSGFVAILGTPNVGKSTLLNRAVGTPLAGVSKRPQTTRGRIRGIISEKRGQIVFVDTPGFHKPKDQLGRFMLEEASKSFHDGDLLYLLVEPRVPGPAECELIDWLGKEAKRRRPRRPVFCVVNKIDRVDKRAVLPVLDQYNKLFRFDEFIPISALDGTQVNVLIDKTFSLLPEHEPYFPEDITSDQTERFVVIEKIREKVFRLMGEEIPYSAAVEINEFKEDEKLIRISAVIYMERDSQKGIVIGSGGQMMKKIGQAARIDLESFFAKKVFLKLWVKTLKNWKKDTQKLKRLGFA